MRPAGRYGRTGLLSAMVALTFCLSAMLGLLAVASSDWTSTADHESHTSEGAIPARSLAMTVHDPIYIDGNAGFTNDSGVVWGSGTKSDPYIIEGWDLSSFPTNGIEIWNADVYFVIRDCLVHDGLGWGAAIYLSSCSNGTINNCTCLSWSQSGVYVSLSNSIRVANTTCSGGWTGISLELSSNNILIDNNCSYNYYGIVLTGSDDNLVLNCSCYDYQNGIELYSSSDTSLIASFLSGLSLFSSVNTTLSQNEIFSCVYLSGEDLSHFNTHSIDTSNTVTGAPFYYYKDQTGISVPSGAGEILMANCTDMRIEGQTVSDSFAGAQLAFCTGAIVSNNTFSVNGVIIRLLFSDNNLLAGNIFCGSEVYLGWSSNNSLMGNNCTDGSRLSLYSANDCDLINNTCTNNEYGVRVYDSDNVSLADNNFSSNTQSGIELENCDNAVLLNNRCLWNDEYYGIKLYDCVNGTLHQNQMVGDGVYIGGDMLTDLNTHSIDTTNTANGKPIYYYKNQNGLSVPAGAGQVLMANCTDMLIENQDLDDASVGIELAFCTATNVYNNSCSNNHNGIVLWKSDSVCLTGNNCSNCMEGIAVWGIGNSLINNTCSSNSWCGIYLGYGSHGNSLVGNILSNNYNGLVFDYSTDNSIRMNRIENNVGYGINIRWGTDNAIWNNTFTHNNGAGDTYDPAHIQACDNGADNLWNSTEGYGNSWSDWTGPDADLNGIVDVPYVIAGSAGAKDYCPLTSLSQEPIPEFGMIPFVVIAFIILIALITETRRRKA